MTKDDIIRMAREAGMRLDPAEKYSAELIPQFVRFAALVSAAERKACAKALKTLEDHRIFVTSREKVKHPEGTELYDEQIAMLRAVLADEIREQTTEME